MCLIKESNSLGVLFFPVFNDQLKSRIVRVYRQPPSVAIHSNITKKEVKRVLPFGYEPQNLVAQRNDVRLVAAIATPHLYLRRQRGAKRTLRSGAKRSFSAVRLTQS